LADRPEEQDLRYVLTLLLIRRRVLRLDVAAEQLGMQTRRVDGENAAESMIVYCPKRDAAYEVPVAMPDQPRIDQIQQRLSDLLIAGAE
jgi:hypothetical protein